MKRGKTKTDLTVAIKKAIYSISDSSIEEKIIKKLIERGYTRGVASDILEGNVLLETISQIELGLMAEVIYNASELSFIKPSIFLEEAEINQVKKYKIKKRKEDKNLLVFENVTQVMPDIWTVVLSPKQIADLYRNNAVTYDFNTQRESENIEFNDTIIKVAKVNWASVEEIQDLLIKNNFISNTITFNVPIEYMDSIKFDPEKRTLMIIDKVLKILDGFHRNLAIIGALRVADIKCNFTVKITCFNDDKANQYIVQEDKRNPISKTHLKSIDSTDRIATIISTLNQSNNSELKGMIATDYRLVDSGKALIKFNFMYNIISKLWNPESIMETNRISEHLTSFFNQLVGTFPNEFKDFIVQSRKVNSINKEQMFFIYIILAQYYEDKEGWKANFKDTIELVNAATTDEFLNTSIRTIERNFQKYVDMANAIVKRSV